MAFTPLLVPITRICVRSLASTHLSECFQAIIFACRHGRESPSFFPLAVNVIQFLVNYPKKRVSQSSKANTSFPSSRQVRDIKSTHHLQTCEINLPTLTLLQAGQQVIESQPFNTSIHHYELFSMWNRPHRAPLSTQHQPQTSSLHLPPPTLARRRPLPLRHRT
jgi:hypothetical protein